jgi:hypothetical protein
MARQRRGGGFRSPELRGTLGTLLRTTLAQAGTLRDALERGAREGRSRLDSALSGRRRQDALADLGETVLDLIRRGEIDLDELPEVRDIVEHLDKIDAGTDIDEHEHEHEHEQAPPPPRAPVRNRFDTRRRDDSDGTVSSRNWSRPSPAKPAPRVWRPPIDEAEPATTDDQPTTPARPAKRKDPARKGGIHFDDDEDLAEYMHPDDVPPKGSSGGDS